MRRLQLVLLLLLVGMLAPLRADETADKPQQKSEKEGVVRPKHYGPPCCCLQQMIQDRPGTDIDVYDALIYEGATCDDGYSDRVCAAPIHVVPQSCTSRNCNPYDNDREATFEPHGMSLSASGAYGLFKAQLESAQKEHHSKAKQAGEPEYHSFQNLKYAKSSKARRGEIIVMAVPLDLPDAENEGKTRRIYFGLEIEDDGVKLKSVQVTDSKTTSGKLSAHYKVDGKERIGTFWLKK